MEFQIDYVTRGGVAIEIEIPLDSLGRPLADRYLTDSEKRRLKALRLREELEPYDRIEFVTLH